MKVDWEKLRESIRKDLEEVKTIWSECHKDIYAGITINISHQRSMITHLALVAGALASFSFLLISSPLVYGKIFLLSAIILLLGVIGWSFYLLDCVLAKESNQLHKLQKQYNDLYPEKIKIMEEMLVYMNKEVYDTKIAAFKAKLKLMRKKEEESEKTRKFKLKWNVSKKILIGVFLFALFLIGISFLKL